MNDIFENTETMQENEHPRFYTAESVMRGHPDKLCDLTHSVVRSMDSARLDREIQRKIATDRLFRQQCFPERCLRNPRSGQAVPQFEGNRQMPG